MRLRLLELQDLDNKAQRIRAEEMKNGYEKIDGILHHQGLPFILEAIRTKVMSWYHDVPVAGYFGIDKTKDLVGQKYYWPSLQKDIKAYVKGYDVCLGSKAVRHKLYGNLQSLPIPTHW